MTTQTNAAVHSTLDGYPDLAGWDTSAQAFIHGILDKALGPAAQHSFRRIAGKHFIEMADGRALTLAHFGFVEGLNKAYGALPALALTPEYLAGAVASGIDDAQAHVQIGIGCFLDYPG